MTRALRDRLALKVERYCKEARYKKLCVQAVVNDPAHAFACFLSAISVDKPMIPITWPVSSLCGILSVCTHLVPLGVSSGSMMLFFGCPDAITSRSSRH